jgi:hypothetical protein
MENEMIPAYITTVYENDLKKQANRELVDGLKNLPISELVDLANGKVTEKTACINALGSPSESWLDKYKGSALFDQAVQLEQQLIQLEMQEQQKREAQKANREQMEQQFGDCSDIYDQKDRISLQKRMLDLQLAQEGAGAMPGGEGEEGEEMGEEEQPAPVPAAAEAPPPAEAPPAEAGGAEQKLSSAQIKLAEFRKVARVLARQDAGLPMEDLIRNAVMEKVSAVLTTQAREKIKTKNFAVKSKGEEKYPIHDPTHARNALVRVRQFGSPAEKAKVYSAVAKKYPALTTRSSVIPQKLQRKAEKRVGVGKGGESQKKEKAVQKVAAGMGGRGRGAPGVGSGCSEPGRRLGQKGEVPRKFRRRLEKTSSSIAEEALLPFGSAAEGLSQSRGSSYTAAEGHADLSVGMSPEAGGVQKLAMRLAKARSKTASDLAAMRKVAVPVPASVLSKGTGGLLGKAQRAIFGAKGGLKPGGAALGAKAAPTPASAGWGAAASKGTQMPQVGQAAAGYAPGVAKPYGASFGTLPPAPTPGAWGAGAQKAVAPAASASPGVSAARAPLGAPAAEQLRAGVRGASRPMPPPPAPPRAAARPTAAPASAPAAAAAQQPGASSQVADMWKGLDPKTRAALGYGMGGAALGAGGMVALASANPEYLSPEEMRKVALWGTIAQGLKGAGGFLRGAKGAVNIARQSAVPGKAMAVAKQQAGQGIRRAGRWAAANPMAAGVMGAGALGAAGLGGAAVG